MLGVGKFEYDGFLEAWERGIWFEVDFYGLEVDFYGLEVEDVCLGWVLC